jgi:hypothetical protein
MAANRDGKAEGLNGESTEDEGRTRCRCGEKHEGGQGEKESGWHDEQSRVFHGLSFSSLSVGPQTRMEWKATLRTQVQFGVRNALGM